MAAWCGVVPEWVSPILFSQAREVVVSVDFQRSFGSKDQINISPSGFVPKHIKDLPMPSRRLIPLVVLDKLGRNLAIVG